MGKHNIGGLDYPNNIRDILRYASIEEYDRNNHNFPRNMELAFGRTCGVRALDWGEYQDVIYSFLSLYAIGLKAYNANKIKIKEVKPSFRPATVYLDLDKKNVWSCDLLKALYDNDSPLVQELNKNKELRKFANRYFSIGNVMPVWPNGNEAKGGLVNCFDIPELYYGNKNKKWFQALVKQFPNAYLDTILTDVGADYTHGTKKFLESISDPDHYTAYLEHVNSVVENRTRAIEAWLSQNRPGFKSLYTKFSKW